MNAHPEDTITLMMVGDLILDEPQPDSFFETCKATLMSADVAIGHVEVPHTLRGTEQSTDVPAPSQPSAFGYLTACGISHRHPGR